MSDISPFSQGVWPQQEEPWPRPGLRSSDPTGQDDSSAADILSYTREKSWTWPGRRLLFLTDLHADAEAFLLPLAKMGAITITGSGHLDFTLTSTYRDAIFVLGGDYFDKGPSNLKLLDTIAHLKHLGADLLLLAGNHDIRTLLGLSHAGTKNPLLQHLFVRMGKKSVRLLQELNDKYAVDDEALDPDEVRNALLPSTGWQHQFAQQAAKHMSPAAIEKELRRVTEKTLQFEAELEKCNLHYGNVAHAIKAFQREFLREDGDYGWFFRSLKLVHREGAYLFLHAGVDDLAAAVLESKGVDGINNHFPTLLNEDPLEAYYGCYGNMLRTKYRLEDPVFSNSGLDSLHRAGIYAIVHGHRNIHQGPRLIIREGMLNFECDASVNANTRKAEKLSGPGGAILIFESDGTVRAASTDYPYIKRFHPGIVNMTGANRAD